MWDSPQAPSFDDGCLFSYVSHITPPAGQPQRLIRMKSLHVPTKIREVIVACIGSQTLAMHLYDDAIENHDDCNEMYQLIEARWGNVIWRNFVLNEKEDLEDIAVRDWADHSSACIALRTTSGRTVTFGHRVRAECRDAFQYQSLLPSSCLPETIFLNEPSLGREGLHIGVRHKQSEYQQRNTENTWWDCDFPNFSSIFHAHQTYVDVQPYQKFFACVQKKTRECIGLRFGHEILGQWRHDQRIEEQHMSELPALRLKRRDNARKRQLVFLETLEEYCDDPADEVVPIAGVMVWRFTEADHEIFSLS